MWQYSCNLHSLMRRDTVYLIQAHSKCLLGIVIFPFILEGALRKNFFNILGHGENKEPGNFEIGLIFVLGGKTEWFLFLPHLS